MNKFGYCFVILLMLILGSPPCHADRLKAYVSRFSVCTPENKEEMKDALQTLLMSRLNSEEIQTIENQSEAEIQIAGSYIAFGTVFSLDAVIRTSSGIFIDRVFIQGDTQNELIPSVAEMAKNLHRAILKWNPALAAKATGSTMAPSVEKAPPVVVKKALRKKPEPLVMPKLQKLPEKPWVSQMLPGTLSGIVSGRSIDAEGLEIFITGEHYLRYYFKEKELQLLAEIEFAADEKIIGVDVADLDQDGVPEVYVSILKGDLPASQVYVPENRMLKKIGDNIPYLLRGIALEGKEKKIFAQKINTSGNFTGDIYELTKSGDNFIARNPMQLPLFGNLYNFNKFSSSKGKMFFIVSHPDGYLLVYSKDKKQLWKSRDKFGGSETSVCLSENPDSVSPLHTACSFSPQQRLLVTKTGDVVVSRNTGLSTSGAKRNYSKNYIVQLSWDGSSLEEKWRTEQSQNYLADFSYDELNRDLLLLEVEPKVDQKEERDSRVVMKKME